MQGSIGQLGKISIHALREEGDVMPFADHLRLINFYPRPPRGGRPDESATEELIRAISIHALREEGDKDDRLSGNPNQIFLSTPSARRATWSLCRNHRRDSYFYPRPPRGGRPPPHSPYLFFKNISIHALREEGDSLTTAHTSPGRYFYPRPPRGGRHGRADGREDGSEISIHALREEGDRGDPCLCRSRRYFYPRPPRGGRPGTA